MNLHQRRMQKGLESLRTYRNKLEGKRVTSTSVVGWNPIGNVIAVGNIEKASSPYKLSEVYSNSEIIQACIREKTTSFAEAELEVGVYTDEGFEAIEGHEALNLFYNNAYYSYAELCALIVARMDLTGVSYNMLDLFTNRQGVGGFTPLPTHVVDMKTKGPEILGYKVRAGDNDLTLAPEEVCPVGYIDPRGYRMWCSPLASVMREHGIDIERAQITLEQLINKDIPGLIFESEVAVNADQAKAFRENLHASTGGDNGSRARSILLPKGIKRTDEHHARDIDFNSLNFLTETRLCMAFGVPPQIISSAAGLEKSIYSNYQEARKSFYRETLQSLWTLVASSLTRCLLSDGLEFRFCTDEIPEFKEDMNEIAKRASLLFEKGVISQDESREMVNLPPVKVGESGASEVTESNVLNGAQIKEAAAIVTNVAVEAIPRDAGIGQLQVMFNLSKQQAEMVMGSTGKGFKPVVMEGMTLEGKADSESGPKAPAAIGSFDDATEMEKALQDEFERQRVEVNKAIARGRTPNMAEIGAATGPTIAQALSGVFNRNFKSNLRKLGIPEPQVQNSFNVVNPKLREAISRQAIQISESTLATTGTNLEQMQKKIRQALVESQVEGANTQEAIIKALTEGSDRVFTNAKDFRARRIAVTESSRAINNANILAGEASGIVQGFVPLVSADACELCQVYDKDNKPTGESLFAYASMDDAKAQLDLLPGEGSLPPYHPNCRCSLVPVLIGETPPAPSGTKREQQGVRLPESARPRPGGQPDKAPPLDKFLRDIVDEVEAGL